MKKFIGIGVFLLAMVLVSSELFAWNSRRGVEWIKDPSRDATIDTVDAAQYNPAGLVNLATGWYVYLGDSMAFKRYQVTTVLGGSNYRTAQDTTPAFLSPNISLAYVFADAALFFTYDIIGGGGSTTYTQSEGLSFLKPLIFNGNTSLSNITHATLYEAKQALSFGLSYGLFNKMVDLSAGIRYLIHDKSVTANAGSNRVTSVSAQLTGWAPFIGINIQPMGRLFNIAIVAQPTMRKRGEIRDHMTGQTYDTETGYKVFGLNFAGPPDEYEPGFMSIGLGVRPMDNLEVQLSFQWTFNGERRIGSANATTGSNFYENQYRRDEIEIGLGAEYNLGMIRPSAGIWYDRTNDVSRSNSSQPWDPGITSTSIGLGVSIVPNEMLRIDVGVLKAFYYTGATSQLTTDGVLNYKYKKDVWVIGIGIAVHI